MSKPPTSCDRLMDGANDAGVSYELLSEEETRAVVERVFDIHFPARDRSGFYKGSGWVWDSNQDAAVVSFRLFTGQFEEDWAQFEQLMSGWTVDDVYVFFEWRDSKQSMRFRSIGDLISSLRESLILDDMYMTDAHSDGLACLNHHDYLIFWGEAVGWVK